MRAARNATAAIAPQVLIQISVGFVRTPAAVGGTGAYNISVLTPDLASISRGTLLETVIGRPGPPQNVLVSLCQADWPTPDPLCINVTWSPPVDTGGSPITGYKVVFDSLDVTFSRIVNTVIVSGPNVFNAKAGILLQVGVQHYVRVESISAAGGVQGFGAGG